MKVSDFAPFFGVQVMLQFKEPIALAAPQGDKRAVPAFNRYGQTIGSRGQAVENPREAAPVDTWPVGMEQRDGKPNFTYVLESACVLPSTDGQRLLVTYQYGQALIELLIDPEWIVACSTVRAAPDPKSIIEA